MFGGGANNPYDDVVAKTTDENLTTENWELILNLCDKVSDDGDEGAHNVIASVLKRLAHRNPNVQLYALSLTDSLSKNCGVAVNKEIASRAFTQGLEKLVTDRTTHDKVRKRALGLIAEWTSEFENDTSLGIMEDCYNNLKSKGYKFDTPQEPLPPTVDDEIRRKEEEELQRVLEMSMQDRGGRGQWSQYSLTSSSAGAASSSAAGSSSRPAASSTSASHGAPRYQGGYVPARTPSPQRQPTHTQQIPQPQNTAYTHSNSSNVSANSTSSTTAPSTVTATSTTTATTTPATSTMTGGSTIVTRVRALHTFEPTEPGELAFEKGDIIKVVDRGYKDWWRGQLKGRTGIFPVNYVEPMPEPTAAELAREAEQEAAVFAQAVNVEKLLNLLRAFDPAKDNLADNEEIQELYRSSMALRPKIVKLIDKYSQKRADLVSMNETFVRARTIFDRMMEESLARHTGVYDQPTYRPSFAHQPSSVPSIRPDSRTGGAGGGREYVTSPVGGAPSYAGYGPVAVQQVPQAFPEPQPAPAPAIGYPSGATPGASGVYGYPGGSQVQPLQPQVQPQPQPQHTQPQHQPQIHPQVVPLQPQHQQQPQPHSIAAQPQPQPQPQVQTQPGPQQQQPAQQSGYTQLANAPYTVQGPTPYPASAQPQPTSPQAQAQSPTGQQTRTQPSQQQSQYGGQSTSYGQGQTSPQLGYQNQPQQQQASSSQVQLSPQPSFVQPQQQLEPAQAQPPIQPSQQQPQQHQPAQQPVQQQQQQQQQQQPSTQTGPPYIFDPTITYSDANVQAWAQYYAQGGRDLAGSVYFVSIPGLTDGSVGSSSGVGSSGGVVTTQGGAGYTAGGGGQAQAQAQAQQQQQGFDQGVYGVQLPGSSYDPTSTSTGVAPGSSSSLGLHQHQQQPNNASSTSLGNSTSNLTTGSPILGGGGVGYGSGHSPSVTAVTPSWVLPKKGGGGGGETQVQGGGLTGRFAGVSLTDPGSASA